MPLWVLLCRLQQGVGSCLLLMLKSMFDCFSGVAFRVVAYSVQHVVGSRGGGACVWLGLLAVSLG